MLNTTETFTKLAVGGSHNCGLTASGAAFCWGRDIEGELGDGMSNGNAGTPQAVLGGLALDEVFAGPYHTCALTSAGAAYCWGQNDGRLGVGHADEETTPAAVTGGHAFSLLALGVHHTCGLTTDGAAYCWGANTAGQLGDGVSTIQSTVPVPTEPF